MTPEDRISAWLTATPSVGESMIWVGKDYSLEQLKIDVRAILSQGRETLL
jgi:hypothetical protein